MDNRMYEEIRNSFKSMGRDISMINDKVNFLGGQEPKKDSMSKYSFVDDEKEVSMTGLSEKQINTIIDDKYNVITKRVADVLQQFQNVMNGKIDNLKNNIDNVYESNKGVRLSIRHLRKDIDEIEEFLLGEDKKQKKQEDRKDGFVNIDTFSSNGEIKNISEVDLHGRKN